MKYLQEPNGPQRKSASGFGLDESENFVVMVDFNHKLSKYLKNEE